MRVTISINSFITSLFQNLIEKRWIKKYYLISLIYINQLK